MCYLLSHKMEILNKKSVLFFFAIALLICSSFADRLPQARTEERELAALDAFGGGFTQAFSKKLGELATRAKWWDGAKKGFNVGIKTGKVYNRVAQGCMKINNCTPANPAQHPLCGGICVFDMLAATGEIKKCVKFCSNQEERSANPQQMNCYYHAGGRITCN